MGIGAGIEEECCWSCVVGFGCGGDDRLVHELDNQGRRWSSQKEEAIREAEGRTGRH